MSAPPPPQRPKRKRQERGVALLIAIISITLLTLTATEFAYNSRVDLQLATNARDELRATYLARSGIGLSRLLLRFQKQLDAIQLPNLGSLIQQFTGGADPQQSGVPQPQSLNLQLWKMARIDCHMLQGMVPQVTEEGGMETEPLRDSKFEMDAEEGSPDEPAARKSFGGFEGCFLATIGNEEEKINLARLDSGQLAALPLVQATMQLLGDKRFEFLWEEEDAHGERVNPQDVLIAIKDWVDEDEVQSSLNLSGQGEVFQKGFSDENYSYDKYEPRYKAKNARFDTLDELFMIHGVNDRFMAAFRDRFTVYPDVNARLNINTDDPMLLYMAIMLVADPNRPDPRLRDPLFVESIIQKIRTARLFSMFGMGVADFVNIVESTGVQVNSSIRSNIAQNRFVSDKSQTFSIKSVGEAGAVQKTISAVVELNDTMGRLLYWREE